MASPVSGAMTTISALPLAEAASQAHACTAFGVGPDASQLKANVMLAWCRDLERGMTVTKGFGTMCAPSLLVPAMINAASSVQSDKTVVAHLEKVFSLPFDDLAPYHMADILIATSAVSRKELARGIVAMFRSGPKPGIAVCTAALATLGRDAKVAVPFLLALAQYGKSHIRSLALNALGATGVTTDAVMQALTTGLFDEREFVAEKAIEGFGRSEPEAAKALALLLGKRPQDASQRIVVLRAVQAMGPKAKALLKPLMQLLQKRSLSEWERLHVIRAIGSMREAAAPATNLLFSNLRSKHAWAQIEAAWALGMIGPAALPTIEKALLSKHWDHVLGALQAMGVMGPAARPLAERARTIVNGMSEERFEYAYEHIHSTMPHLTSSRYGLRPLFAHINSAAPKAQATAKLSDQRLRELINVVCFDTNVDFRRLVGRGVSPRTIFPKLLHICTRGQQPRPEHRQALDALVRELSMTELSPPPLGGEILPDPLKPIEDAVI